MINSKRNRYKDQLEQALIQNNWEIKEIDSSNEWWDDEHWHIENLHKHSQVYICFVVTPFTENFDGKRQEIATIKACTHLPNSWNDDSSVISSLNMLKGKFDAKLAKFISELNVYNAI